jgi:hypothetical protein
MSARRRLSLGYASENSPHLFRLPPSISTELNINTLSAMSIVISPIAILTAALSIAWLVWKFWEITSPAKSLRGVPLVEFDENNTRQRYATEAGSLLGKGYETVSYIIHAVSA